MKVVQDKEDAKSWIKSVKLEKEVYRQSTQSCPCGGEHICVEMTKSEDSFVICAECWEQASYEDRIMNPYMARKRRERYNTVYSHIAECVFMLGLVNLISVILGRDAYLDISNYWGVHLLFIPLIYFILMPIPILFFKAFLKYAPPCYIWRVLLYDDNKKVERMIKAESINHIYEQLGCHFKIDDIEFVREMTKEEVFNDYDPRVKFIMSSFQFIYSSNPILELYFTQYLNNQWRGLRN